MLRKNVLMKFRVGQRETVSSSSFGEGATSRQPFPSRKRHFQNPSSSTYSHSSSGGVNSTIDNRIKTSSQVYQANVELNRRHLSSPESTGGASEAINEKDFKRNYNQEKYDISDIDRMRDRGRTIAAMPFEKRRSNGLFVNVTSQHLTPSTMDRRSHIRGGMDEYAFRRSNEGGKEGTSPRRPLSREERRKRTVEALESGDMFDEQEATTDFRKTASERSGSFVNFTNDANTMDEGDSDGFDEESDNGTLVDMGGLPEDQYNGKVDGITISTKSSMYNSIFARGALDSRSGTNSWSTIGKDRITPLYSHKKDDSDHNWYQSGDNHKSGEEEVLNELRERNSIHDRQWRENEGLYQRDFDDPNLEYAHEAVQHTVSIYTKRKMYVDGLFGIERFITRHEEKVIAEELMHLTQHPSAVFIAEESRYCVNLYETELGTRSLSSWKQMESNNLHYSGTSDEDKEYNGNNDNILAFSMNRDAPTLFNALVRAYDVGLIPSIPNTCQVSEFVGSFSGYPMHRKHPSIGPYVGVMSLISPTIMSLRHIQFPWAPRLYLRPRSLFLMEQPCLGEYKMGFTSPHRAAHVFRHATRQSKDYRIEILFASVDVKQTNYLQEAVDLTKYAKEKVALQIAERNTQLLQQHSLLLEGAKEDVPNAVPTPDIDAPYSMASRLQAMMLSLKPSPAVSTYDTPMGDVTSTIDTSPIHKSVVSGIDVRSHSNSNNNNNNNNNNRKEGDIVADSSSTIDGEKFRQEMVNKGFVGEKMSTEGASPINNTSAKSRLAALRARRDIMQKEQHTTGRIVYQSDPTPAIKGRYPNRAKV